MRATLERRRLAPNPLATLNQLTTPVIFPPEYAPSAGSADGFSPSPSGGADASFTESAASSLANASPFPPLIVEWWHNNSVGKDTVFVIFRARSFCFFFRLTRHTNCF